MLGSLFQKRPRRPASVGPSAVADNRGVGAVDTSQQPPIAQSATKTGATPHEVDNPGRNSLLELLAELEANRKAAGEASGDRMATLRTEAWDGSQRAVNSLPAELQGELESVYADINVLNQLVWLSSEFQPASPSLRARYVSLSLGIAHRLDEVVRSPRF